MKFMVFLSIFTCAFSGPGPKFSPFGDRILISNISCDIIGRPIETFLKTNTSLAPLIKYPIPDCAPGYYCKFEITNSLLVLTEIITMPGLPIASNGGRYYTLTNVFSQVFQGRSSLILTTFSGTILANIRTNSYDSRVGYYSRYAGTIALVFKNGVISQQRKIDVDEIASMKFARFNEFKNTSTYSNILTNLNGSKYDGINKERFIFDYLFDKYYISEFPEFQK